jgi:uncharacterized protein YciI
MLYVVLFEDNPKLGADVRKAHMPQHLAFLEGTAISIHSAGPLRTKSNEPAGGLWIVEAGTVKEVEDLVERDPFWPTGLRQSVQILEWTQVFADGKRLVGGAPRASGS